MERPQIDNFDDATVFLAARYEFDRSKIADWTYGRWAKRLGLKDTSSITKVLNGQRSIGPQLERSLLRYLDFNERESDYFRALVQVGKVRRKSVPSAKSVKKALGKDAPPKPPVNVQPHEPMLAIYQTWYAAIIRELAAISGLKLTEDKIAKILRPGISLAAVRKTVADLVKAEAIVARKDGTLASVDAAVESQTEVPMTTIRRFHRLGLDQAKDAIESVPLASREFQMVAFAMPISRLPEAKKMIREFKDKFADKFEVSRGFDREPYAIFQTNLCFFPVTRPISGNTIS